MSFNMFNFWFFLYFMYLKFNSSFYQDKNILKQQFVWYWFARYHRNVTWNSHLVISKTSFNFFLNDKNSLNSNVDSLKLYKNSIFIVFLIEFNFSNWLLKA